MLNNNTKEVNKIIASSLAWLSVLLILLLSTNIVGIFHFKNLLKVVIWSAILFVCILPSIFIKINISDDILKYYMLIALSVFICALGTSNKVGIYITYILVPLVSCMYFDKRFTILISIISYFTMAFGVYVNSAGKYEVIFLNWTHFVTFRNYMIGFTIEYLAVMIFIIQLVSRSQHYLESQQENLKILKEENEVQKKINSIYKNTVSEQKTTALSIISNDIDSFTPEFNTKLGVGHRFIVSLQDIFMYEENHNLAFNQVLTMVGEYFKIDRILYIEILPEEGKSKLSLQWNKDCKNYINDYYEEMPIEVQNAIANVYREKGYIELLENQNYEVKTGFTDYMLKIRLGSQLWIPALVDGKFVGAMCFDRILEKRYSTLEKYLLAEAVGIVSTNMNRMNSENANHAKSNFLSNMSHEIRTPMNAIMGMTNVALREDVNANVRKCLNTIKSSSEGLMEIINDILDFSKIESGKIEMIPQEYRLMSLINDVYVMVNARNIDKKLDIIMNIESDMPSVLKGDYVRLKQVMVNLVTNAIKYTDEGSINIYIKCEKQDENHTILKFKVKDTGQGIKEEDMKKLFFSYSQVNKEKNHHVEGTGLGLAISKQLIDLMGGNIHVKSKYGVGSSFCFEVPQIIIDDSPAGTLDEFEYDYKSEDKFMNFKATGKKILIVDDNKINLMIEEAIFEPLEMDITTVESGKGALELLENNVYDLIFMDHFMPEMDGIETTKLIRKLEGNPNQNIPIIALTADVIAGVKEEMISAGMNDFLSKPIDLNHAVKILKKHFYHKK